VDFQDGFLHESESQLTHEDLLVLFEQSSGHPLEDGHSDHFSQGEHSGFFFLKHFSLVNGLEEEGDE
jgi:hypothetical protein